MITSSRHALRWLRGAAFRDGRVASVAQRVRLRELRELREPEFPWRLEPPEPEWRLVREWRQEPEWRRVREPECSGPCLLALA